MRELTPQVLQKATELINRLRSHKLNDQMSLPVSFPFRFYLTVIAALALNVSAAEERTLTLNQISNSPTVLKAEVGDSGQFTWWLPAGADEYVLPISAGIVVNPARAEQMRFLTNDSPWSLTDLPVLGARYRDKLIVVIVPWPSYAELVISNRIGIQFTLPKGRPTAAPVEIVVQQRAGDPLEVARAFREWRRAAADIGEIPRPRTLTQKFADLEKAKRLAGAPHFYLWGPALFSRHDLPAKSWIPFANALQKSPAESFGGQLLQYFSNENRKSLKELASAQWPMNYLTLAIAEAINKALSKRELLKPGPDVVPAEVIQRNQKGLHEAFPEYLDSPETWGDGLSIPMLNNLHAAGVDRALLVLSDLYGQSFRPDVVAQADKFGFLIGPYDSYHSVHSPKALPDQTWETAQFDDAAYENGRLIKADGSGRAGFKKRGYLFSPQAAWPYVQARVNRITAQAPYSAWFIDCDATAECFDDYSPTHPATRIEDTKIRRQRLAWLETGHQMVVGSEGGSVLFADVIHFGHGIQTPYLGHLDPAFRDKDSKSYLGRSWPPDAPDNSFKPVVVPPSLMSPYFDPTVRIPLYQAAVGDEVIATHHWSFDSLKFSDVKQTRELMEILYLVPPMYHLSRDTWPKRRQEILKHVAFWSPLHRQLVTAPLTRFEILSADRFVQRTTFQLPKGDVSITVNFSQNEEQGLPPLSATVTGPITASQRVFQSN